MFRTIANKLLMVIYFVIGALILEALTFSILDLGFMPEYFWYNLSIILVIGFVVFIIPNYVAQYTIYTILLTVQMVLAYINYSLSQVYGDLLSLEMIRLIGEAGAAMTSSFVYISVLLELILVFVVIVTLGAIILKYCRKDKNEIKQHFTVFSILLILSTQMFGIGLSIQIREKVNAMTSIIDEQYTLSDKFLMNTSILKTSSYQKFGTFGYFTNMIANAIRNEGNAIEKVTLDYFNSGNIYDGTYVDANGNKKSNNVFGIDEGNNVIVIMMESIEWFGFGDGTYDPTFSNLLYIDDQLAEKTLTPNVTKLIYGDDYLTNISNLSNEALIAKNFFAKSKTNMSEGQGIIGNYPIAQALTDIVANDTGSKQALGYAMPYVMQRKGYTTTYVHSHDIDYYSRKKTHDNLGFQNVVGKNNVTDSSGNYIYTGDELDFHNWDAEGRFAENALKYIIPEDRSKPFYTFYLNVSSHGPFTQHKNENDGDANKYYYYVKYGEDDCTQDANGDWILNKSEKDATPTLWYSNVLRERSDISEDLVYYQSGVKGLDDAIGVIVNKLKTTKVDDATPLSEKSLFDKTTLLLYSDHYAYYDNLSHINKRMDIHNNNAKELNIIPMIISSPGLRNYNENHEEKFLVNNRFASAYDVVPTLFDLLGVNFNENLYVGHSLFKPADFIYTENAETKDMMVYYSNTGGLFGDNIYTFDMKTFITPANYSTETIDVFKTACNQMLVKINFITFLNRYNLYHKIEKI